MSFDPLDVLPTCGKPSGLAQGMVETSDDSLDHDRYEPTLLAEGDGPA